MATTTSAAEAADASPLAATSESHAKDDARNAIPWKKLSPAAQQRVKYVVGNASLYRRLPTRVEPCDPEVFDFLTRRPEVITGVWNLMGISKLTLARESNHIWTAEDHQGGEGRFEVLYSKRDANARGVTVAIIDGLYHQKPMPRPIRAQCVMLLRSGSAVQTNGQTYVTARLDTFVKFERVAADLVARGLQPLLVQTADHNFVETMKFVSTFSRTAETNPQGMQRLAEKLTGLDPTGRAEMNRVCQRAHQRAQTLTSKRAAEAARIAQLREREAVAK